jgi:hypothetical protein
MPDTETTPRAPTIPFDPPRPAWTDYPITELGDTSGEIAPIRSVSVVGWDGDKYATVIVEGIRTEIKRGYLYAAPGRCGEVNSIDLERVRGLADLRVGDEVCVQSESGRFYDMRNVARITPTQIILEGRYAIRFYRNNGRSVGLNYWLSLNPEHFALAGKQAEERRIKAQAARDSEQKRKARDAAMTAAIERLTLIAADGDGTQVMVTRADLFLVLEKVKWL